MAYSGKVEVLNANVCSGWVANELNPTAPLKILLIVNGVEVRIETVDLYREDLGRPPEAANCGFSFGMSSHLSSGKNVVQIRVLGDSFDFDGFQSIIDDRDKESFVEVGEDGWLFLQNDVNETDKIIAGERSLSPEDLEMISDEFRRRIERSSSLGAKYLTFVVPEKNIVCSEKRGRLVPISPNRPANQLAELVPYHFVYGLEALHERLSDPLSAYTKTDTHLSDVGRVGLFPEIMNLLGLESCVEWESRIQENFQGDLGSKLSPAASIAYEVRDPKISTSKIVDRTSNIVMNGGRLRGSTMYHENQGGLDLTCVLFGTSNAYFSRREFFANFRRCHFYWENTYDPSFMEMVKPDVIVHIATERTISTTWARQDISIPRSDH
ncbi:MULTISPECIES: hypothetical protein [Agrobacterium]|uniref:hypothetical protein n=1 Tax=Agrobacterium TaxID=357 RepID=UPI000DD434FE|nr:MULTISPECIES: hypothetical protein [Agrobacterium]KAA3527533.1 hypothetical protein DXM29_13565 [Agrobacterium tumefaciens]MBO9108223.1 hypothetical protein [Agrobacterium sp. S2/73]NTA15451.1 hypothetical protein [Agrobacterium tumefaciens]NTA80382.1 hypothetical protein [Agrobacterium tumefaciens]QXZ71190.1 hypothetical protein J5276_08700 [Agrobacterium sp. S7/73]